MRSTRLNDPGAATWPGIGVRFLVDAGRADAERGSGRRRVVLWVGLDPFLVHYSQPLIDAIPSSFIRRLRLGPLWLSTGGDSSLACRSWRNYFGRLPDALADQGGFNIGCPSGTYQPLSFWITTACFAVVHARSGPWAWSWGALCVWYCPTRKAWGKNISCSPHALGQTCFCGPLSKLAWGPRKKRNCPIFFFYFPPKFCGVFFFFFGGGGGRRRGGFSPSL